MTGAMGRIAAISHPAFPQTIYYAFKQAESETTGETVSTGWETFLSAVIRSGFVVTGTWPIRTEKQGRIRSNDSNALASSIILVCHRRAHTAESISRRGFIRALNAELPLALDAMTRESEGQHSPVAPVDLSQAIIGPGMAVFSKYTAVLEADGSPMSVKTALQLINRFLADDDFDPDTQFCLRWFEQHRWEAGQFGEADVLARAKGTSVEGVKQSGVISASSGKVQLVRPAEYPADWDPATDHRLPIWEALHQLIRIFRTDGESASGRVLSQIESKAEPVRQLAYRLYTLCERAGLAEEARAYNELITSWSGIESAASKEPALQQGELF
jgi:putative DNA methylase